MKLPQNKCQVHIWLSIFADRFGIASKKGVYRNVLSAQVLAFIIFDTKPFFTLKFLFFTKGVFIKYLLG